MSATPSFSTSTNKKFTIDEVQLEKLMKILDANEPMKVFHLEVPRKIPIET